MSHKPLVVLAFATLLAMPANAQSELYPRHFDLSEVTLLDSPLKTAMDRNIETLLEYDADRLLTPFVRQAGLSATTDTSNKYYKWESLHPSFTNWGDSGFDLSGHVGGHYLTALALAYAACHDTATKAALKERIDYMVAILKDCQDVFDNDATGLYGFIGGQPINDVWQSLYTGNTAPFLAKTGWVPFYCEHKVLAGLRDIYLYVGDETAKELFRKLSLWACNVVAKLSDSQMQTVLGVEHGGMNETLADAYVLFGDEAFLDGAKKYSHKTMLNGMQTLNTTFLDGYHANTQVPKYIGFERIAQLDATATTYDTAAKNFWTDVAENRTVCIGGNSMYEHFLPVSKASDYINNLDGPESCNSNNMLKLSELLSDATGDARYADLYEYTMWNHILSTQDPTTGGYVYFTTLRPQGYRIYSQVNQAMWCCVGTGMENHSKYGHFIYTHDGTGTLYVNLFTASQLDDANFAVTQETNYPYEEQTKITVRKAGTYTIAIRHPWWTTDGYAISINGAAQDISVTKGTATYVTLNRTWSEGDVITVSLPMELRYDPCPNYTDYIAFEYGPMLLAAQTTAETQAQADATGLPYEELPNLYAGEGRMDHAPGSMASSKKLNTAHLLIGSRDTVLQRVKPTAEALYFTVDDSIAIRPFYDIHHARYQCYWYQQTAEAYAQSDMAQAEEAAALLQARTIDFVSPGEQQSEAGHEYDYSNGSATGSYNGEHYRDAGANGHIQYSLFNTIGASDSLSILLRFTTADAGRMGTLAVDGVTIANITVASSVADADNGFYNVEYPIPANLMTNADGSAKEKFVVRLTASSTTLIPGLYGMRLMGGYDNGNYRFMASEWKTGDTWRLAQSNISYDTEANTITVTSTGTNNVCLTLDYANTDYSIPASAQYLVVRGQNLLTTAGANSLWWLNGINKGSTVAAETAKTTTYDGTTYQIIAWNLLTSGINDNLSTSAASSICRGATIFGMTADGGRATIYDINFVSDVNLYIDNLTTAITTPSFREGWGAASTDGYYTLAGVRVDSSMFSAPNAMPRKGIYIHNGRKVVIK